jgi:hypothetical protein
MDISSKNIVSKLSTTRKHIIFSDFFDYVNISLAFSFLNVSEKEKERKKK